MITSKPNSSLVKDVKVLSNPLLNQSAHEMQTPRGAKARLDGLPLLILKLQERILRCAQATPQQQQQQQQQASMYIQIRYYHVLMIISRDIE